MALNQHGNRFDTEAINEKIKNAEDIQPKDKNHIHTGDGVYVTITKREDSVQIRDVSDAIKIKKYEDYFVSDNNLKDNNLINGDVDKIDGFDIDDKLEFSDVCNKNNIDIDDR